MAAAYLFYQPRFRPLDDNGDILPGAKVTFYDTGTTTKTDVYADDDLSTPLSNPVVADASGEFVAIYLDPTTTYRVQLHNADDELQYDIDPLAPPRDYPAGTVVMFHGTEVERDAAYPSSLWQLCDGTNGSPDMRDRMPIGAGVTYASGETGGSSSATTAADGGHNHGGATGGHTLTESEMPAHQHGLIMSEDPNTLDVHYQVHSAPLARGLPAWEGPPSTGYVIDFGGEDDVVEEKGGGGAHDHTISSAADHTHGVTVDPPRCGIWFLMRSS